MNDDLVLRPATNRDGEALRSFVFTVLREGRADRAYFLELNT